MQGARAPVVAPRGTLAPSGERVGNPANSRDLAVVFASPSGEASDAAEITVVFDRAMRSLEVAGAESAVPVALKPSVPGRWQWIGTHAVSFIPEGHLPHATRFEVVIPAGTRALDGASLASDYRYAFTTPLPSVVSTTPWDGAQELEPSQTFRLRFDEPIADAEITRAVSLGVEGKDGSIPFSVKRPEPKDEREVELVPSKLLPLDASVKLVVEASLRGREGPLAAGKTSHFSFRTYGPLRMTGATCDTDTPHGKCAVDGGVSVALTGSVKFRALKGAFSIEPPVALRWPSFADDDDLESVYLNGKFTPGKRYTLRVRGGATGPRDSHGQSLADDWSTTLAFDDRWPEASIGVSGSYLEPEVRKDIPIGSVNVGSYEVVSAALDEAGILGLERDAEESLAFDKIAALPGAKTRSVHTHGRMNAQVEERIRTEDALGGKDRRGPVIVGLRYTERPGTDRERVSESRSIVQVTDLAISAKVSKRGSLVWVTRLSTGAPVAGATVSIRRPDGPPGPVFTTDSGGLVRVPATSFVPTPSWDEHAVIFARTSDDFAYRRAASRVNEYRLGVPVSESDDRAFGLVFSDRGIYRPGDVVHLKGIVREEASVGASTPAGKTVTVRVEAPNGEVFANEKLTASAFGTFAFDARIPPTAGLGTYSVSATVDAKEQSSVDVYANFEVAEYKPTEFKASVQSSQSSYVSGDSASFTARGDFLFGAPMSGADVRFSVTHEPTSFEPPGLPEGFSASQDAYISGLPDASPRSSELVSSRAKLDAKGAASVDTKLTVPGLQGPELITCEAEITDLSRQTIAARSTTLLHPSDAYAAVNVGESLFVPVAKTIKPAMLAVDVAGKATVGRPFSAELIRRTWSVARQTSGRGGLHTESTPVDAVVASCHATSEAKPVSCELAAKEPGLHFVRVTTTDAKGRRAFAASTIFATSDGAGVAGWGDGDSQQVELTADRKSYTPGQTAHILVKSPFKSADALVTVERAGILSERRVKLVGPTPMIDVPITDELRPNAFVSVLLIQGRTSSPKSRKAAPDVGAPTYRLGYTTLLLDPSSRRLTVRVTSNKTDYRPGEAIDVDVQVSDAAGKPARTELALYGVDEGVLSLVRYKTPDPLAVFAAPRALGVFTIEARQALARIASPFGDGLDKGLEGGDGHMGPAAVRRDFRASAFYTAAIVTDASGHARGSFKLPDGLTTYRIMAVGAAEDDRFGFGEARVTTSRPLMVRPALPRILRAGDAFDASVIVTSKGLADAHVDVAFESEGLFVAGPTSRAVDVPKDGSIEVRFPTEARAVGTAKLRFKVRAPGGEDSVEVVREVVTPMVPEAVALYGETTSASAEQLGDLSAIRGDVGGLELKLSSTALVGLENGMDQLVEYPYGCTEQLTSRLVPLLPLRQLAADFGLPLPPGVDGVVEKTVAKILANQRADGGFGLWAESPRASAWVTAYALWGLNEASRRGAIVPAHVIENATRFLRRELERSSDDAYALATSPFVLDVLGMSGMPDPGRISKVFDVRDELPLFSRALLLHAMVVAKSDPASIEKLTTELEGHIRLDGPKASAVSDTEGRYAVLLDSEARTSALVLRSLVAAKPAHPLAPKLVAGLLAERRGGTWRSTQETAWALLALDDYRRAQEASPPDFDARVFFGQAEIHAASFKGRSTKQDHEVIPASRLVGGGSAPIAFSVDGSGHLFYEARLRYARKELPREGLDRGFFVQKTLRAVSPEGLADALRTIPGATKTTFQGGEMVLADVVVVTPSPRDFVVIDDPLPAGIEAVDARLATSSSAAAAVDSAGDPEDDEAAAQRSWFLREIRDDRVLFFVDHMPAGIYRYRYLARATSLGTFVLPPTRAEEMYTPEVFGRTGADVVRVSARP